MILEHIPFEQTHVFSKLFLDYINQYSELQDWHQDIYPTLENIKKNSSQKVISSTTRKQLVSILSDQYKNHIPKLNVEKNIKLLGQENTFTITTGHQLNLCTGPVFFIYKLITTLNLCTKLKEKFPFYNFVPIYWMASEDHDKEEINHFNLFGKKYTWETDQEGPVGRFHLQGMEKVLENIRDFPLFIKKIYTESPSLSHATHALVHHLFGDQGLVVINPDDSNLKKIALPILEQELTQSSSFNLIQHTSSALEKKGYKLQLHPREINLFYISSYGRQRIAKENNTFKIIDTPLIFTPSEIREELNNYPERFSPNAALRPIYQETLLPNIAYVAGPAEIAYWLQLKDVFKAYGLRHPLLIPRQSALYISPAQNDKLKKLELTIADLFLSKDDLKNKYMASQAQYIFDSTLEKNQIQEVINELARKATIVDTSLEGMVQAEYQSIKKSIEYIEKKIKKAIEQKEEKTIQQLFNLKDKLFPEGHLQERYDNVLNFYINNPSFIQELIRLLDPLDFRFVIIREER